MKRAIFLFLALTFASIVFLVSWSVYHSLQDEKTNSYGRFYSANEEKNSNFNWFSLLSPIQTEAQKIARDTVNFEYKVIYPYAKKFSLVEPASGFESEQYAADELERIINDSVNRITINSKFDYDGTSLSVRRYSNTENLFVSKPEIDLRLYGTASPEARKYGLEKSLALNNLEIENVELAKARLDRTAGYLEEKGFKITAKSSYELQLEDENDVAVAVKNPAILDSMRYVVAVVNIPIEKLEVTTITAPVLLPLWFALSILGLGFLLNLKSPRFGKTKLPGSPWHLSWNNVLKSIRDIIFLIVLLFVLIISLILYIPWILLILIILLIILAYFYVRYRRWSFIASALDYLFLIFVWMIEYISFIIMVIRRRFRFWINDFRMWWSVITTCQRVLFFLIPYALLVTILAIYLWFRN